MRTSALAIAGLVLAAGALGPNMAPTSAQERRPEALVDQVKKAIDEGVRYLRARQGKENWEADAVAVGALYEGGVTSLAMLALLNAGVPAKDQAIQRGLEYLRGLQPKTTYVRALQTMVYAEAAQKEDRQRIVDNVKWLLEARVFKDNKFRGWTYESGGVREPDGSNIQYAVLGLLAGRQGGAVIKREVWEEIREFYVKTQAGEGYWKYTSQGLASGSPLTMTEAGVCGLLIAGMELNKDREIDKGNGTFGNCGDYGDDKHLNSGMSWLGKRGNFQIGSLDKGANFYNIYGIERVGRLSGQRFIGVYDWYREGCEWLVKNQKGDGSWQGTGPWDNWPVVSTSFSLLFLSKGRTPVLISKLVHGERDLKGAPRDTDWNNDRNDLRHLTEFASKKVFEGMPLAWQSFDMDRALRGPTDSDIAEVASELLPSPIAYFNGHKSPLLRFSKGEQEVLKKYVENGGFVLVEACCGREEFDKGFKELAKRLWPDNPLDYLSADHPVWTAFPKLAVNLKRAPKLMGINLGCKTVLIYSPQDLSCRWESNKLDDPLVAEGFNLGANIIAYATGLEPPKPRGTVVPVAEGKRDPPNIPRGFFKVGQLRHTGDAKMAPRAMRNLMERLNIVAGLDVSLETKFDLSVYDKDTVDYKFLYMHGRGDFQFVSENDALKNLRFNLENGGLLFADACCGKEAFDKSFRKFMAELFPEKLYPREKFPGAKLQQIPPGDELFSAKLNGEALTDKNIRARTEKGGAQRPITPYLEGIKLGNRWVVIYSKYDIGCALEKHQSSDCLGYDVESSFKLAGAAVLYTLRP